MQKIFLPLIFIVLSFSGYSQDSEKIKDIKKMLELTGSGKMGIQVMQNLLTSFKKSFPDVDEKFWDDFMREIKPEDLDALIIPIYDKYYTEEEIKQLIKFYNSPIGKKSIDKMPAIMQESMEVGQNWGREVADKVIAQLKEKGYYKEK